MNRDKWFFQHVLLYYFDLKKTAAEAYRLKFLKLMINKFHQREQIETGLNNSKVVISVIALYLVRLGWRALLRVTAIE